MNLTNARQLSEFGVVGDGSTLNTNAIQAAIDTVSKMGGGEIVFPAGKYLTGTIYLKDGVTLTFSANATLLGASEISQYPEIISNDTTAHQALIIAENVQNIGLLGPGTINGQGWEFPCGTEGFNWEDEAKAPQGEAKPRPNLIHIERCEHVDIRNIGLRDSAAYNALVIDTRDLRIENVRIRSRSNQNTDGFHLAGCENVFISGCDIDCGDDAFPLSKSARNVVITNCIITTRWAAFRMGPWSTGVFENIAVSNCVVHNTYGCAIKLQEVEGGTMRNISFDNLVIEHTTGPISIRLGGYLGWKGERKESLPIGTFENVRFSNIRATVADNSYPMAHEVVRMPGEVRSCINITAVPGYYVRGVTLSNCHFTFPGGGTEEEAQRRVPELRDHYPEYHMFGTLPAYGLYLRHVSGITLDHVTFDLESPDFRAALVGEDVLDLDLSHIRLSGTAGEGPALRFSGVKGASIHGCRLLSEAQVFLQLEGDGNESIRLTANDIREAKKEIDFTEVTGQKAIT